MALLVCGAKQSHMFKIPVYERRTSRRFENQSLNMSDGRLCNRWTCDLVLGGWLMAEHLGDLMFRRHWFDIGLMLGVIVGIGLLMRGSELSELSIILWCSLISLFAHQFEEYRFPGWFPGMLNVVLFRSSDPARYPLNLNSALAVNVFVGWGSYLAAAIWGTSALWLVLATLTVSVGNCVFHLIFMPLRGCRPYNPGMATSLVFFIPIVVWFFISTGSLLSVNDWILGIALGAVLNALGVVGLIHLMSDRNTSAAFEDRQVTPALRFARSPIA